MKAISAKEYYERPVEPPHVARYNGARVLGVSMMHVEPGWFLVYTDNASYHVRENAVIIVETNALEPAP